MNEVVLDAVAEPPQVEGVHKLVEVTIDILPRHRRFRPCREVDDADTRCQLDDPLDLGVLRAREDVHVEPHPAELARHLAHVDVHAARFFAAEGRQRAGVHAQHRGPHRPTSMR